MALVIPKLPKLLDYAGRTLPRDLAQLTRDWASGVQDVLRALKAGHENHEARVLALEARVAVLPEGVSVLVEALGTAKVRYVVSPVSGTVRQVFSVLDADVDGDNTLTFAINGVAMTGGTVTHLASGSVAGEVQACTPTAKNLVLKGQALSAETDGGGDKGQARVTFLIEQR